jgi:[glutamine synthetase] adenylyltransferase / [glutamine synthetase]-adenylyl-L-tyrosine phosphorylase
MRQLLEDERPPKGPWDLKLSPGGLVDIEFAAQFLQLAHAADGGPLRANTAAALAGLGAAELASADAVAALSDAWRLQQDLTQLLKVALGSDPDPAAEPKAFQALLSRAGGVKTFRALEKRLAEARLAARKAYLEVVA